MLNKKVHKFVTEYECAKELNYKVDEVSLLLDIKFLLQEFYCATFANNEKSLEITFNNGQKFKLKVEKLK